MKRLGSISILAATAALVTVGSATPGATQSRQPGEMRCGWYANPTPANHYLTDRDGTWTLMEQGGRGAPGMEVMPDMTTGDWVRMNGYYGYGCACMRMTVNLQTRRVTRLYSARPIALSRCERDRALRPMNAR